MGKVQRLTVCDVPWITEPKGKVIVIRTVRVGSGSIREVRACFYLPPSVLYGPLLDAWWREEALALKDKPFKVIGHVDVPDPKTLPYEAIDQLVQDAFAEQGFEAYAIKNDPADEPTY